MKIKIAILAIVSALVLVAVAAYFVVPAPDGNSVEQLKEVVVHIAPERYYKSDLVYQLQETEEGQRRAMVPRHFESGEERSDPHFQQQEGFVGPESCKECHAEYYEGFIQTAHYKTSALASESSILGSFADNENVMKTKHDGFRYEMTEEEGKYFQKLLVDKLEKTYEHKCQFDIVTGSGNVGQTYLYWKENSLYQLPVSWFSSGGWVNSPNYPDGLANFARPVQEGCMACHATKVDFASEKTNIADSSTMILGVTCERCHGPASSHVDYHRENPDAADAKFITHPNDLPRQRMNDICAQCHSGKGKTIKSMFKFRPGDSFHEFKILKNDSDSIGSVHTANQSPRMLKSKCYAESDTMNCATCHNPHKHERGMLSLFSQRCMKCHESKDCGKFPEHGKRIESNCIDCHMPKRDDTDIALETSTEIVFPEVRDHFIRIDNESTQRVEEAWKQESK